MFQPKELIKFVSKKVHKVYTAIFNKGCPSKSVNYERARDDGLLFIFISNSELFFWNSIDGIFTCYKGNSPSIGT